MTVEKTKTPNRIFVCGDVHAGESYGLRKLTSAQFEEGLELTKDDYVIVLGDFGFLWSTQASDHEMYHYKWFEEKPWTTLFLDGNHENFERLDSLETVEMFGSPVGKVNNSIYHLRRGYVYDIAGRSIFTFGGGYSIDKARRVENISWWAREMPNFEEYTRGLDELSKRDNKVDYILTHTCSNRMFKEIAERTDMSHKMVEGENQIRKYFDVIEKTVQRKMWYYGHFHFDFFFKDHSVLYHVVREIV